MQNEKLQDPKAKGRSDCTELSKDHRYFILAKRKELSLRNQLYFLPERCPLPPLPPAVPAQSSQPSVVYAHSGTGGPHGHSASTRFSSLVPGRNGRPQQQCAPAQLWGAAPCGELTLHLPYARRSSETNEVPRSNFGEC